ncbi:hypothetical protein E3N88_32689 [Mikania micrantha]|uniref:BHLH domain-containing protein n=1 Tax=Mikania micrantha TaxID=192012 RepID=A0A5N6M948_9ASTR|nr:hypothetical protein E3N88_32689 [Mikania micrantha]
MDDRPDSSDYSITHFNGGNFNMFQPDFTPETDFENLISAIQGETTDPIQNFCLNYECNHFTHSCTGLQLPPPPYDHHDATFAAGIDIDCYDHVVDPSSVLVWNHEMKEMNVSEVFVDDDSSETATADKPGGAGRKTGGGPKGDRTRTLISERKRRSGMKEKLYALRSLVPNITKMDKASIVGDAARYIQDLQTQSKNLRTEIAAIEANKTLKTSAQNSKHVHLSDQFPTLKKISKLDMYQVDEKAYYVRLVCNNGRGVAVLLHRALESITSFQVQSSNLSTVGDDFVLTFTLNIMPQGFDINLPNLKLWLSSAFINQARFNQKLKSLANFINAIQDASVLVPSIMAIKTGLAPPVIHRPCADT